MAINHRLRFLLCLLTFKTGFSAEISVVVQTGNYVQLDIQTQELPKFDDLSWKNYQSKNILKYFYKTKEVIFYPSYKDRVEFNNKTFSLTLKNMQKTDSGLYRAIAAAETDNNIVTYRVSVIDTVEAPVLTVNSNWISGNFCTVNFTCRTQELMINSSYQNNTCSPEEVTSHENYTLILHCGEELIICNHTNPVSWKEDRINITQLCVNKENDSNNNQRGSSLLWSVGFTVTACIFICLSVFLYCKYKKGAQEEVVADSAVYASVEAEAKTQKEMGDNRPTSVYCTVGQYQKPTVSPDNRPYNLFSGVQTKPDTISPDDT
ncbi:CD48 antigen-like [Labeo rohita]|uniref:CD48 antigen-like n=1 Tax=Labeo rohita TaxID=84645 RepID=UPI0021E22CDF|nr:CD48 antigen-like [Labeo rohita]